MLFIPILASLGVLRLGLSVLTSEDKGGLPQTFKRFASGLSLTLAGIGTLLLAATYDDEDLPHLINLAHAGRAARLKDFMNCLVVLRPIAPGISRTIAFAFFVKAILMGSDAFRRCDRLENSGPTPYDLMVTIRAVEGVRGHVKEPNGEAREASVIASDSETTVAEITPELLPQPGKTLVTQAKAISRPNDTAVESTVVIQLKSDPGVTFNPAHLSALDSVVTETLTALIPATLRAMEPTRPLRHDEKIHEQALDKAMQGLGRRGFTYIEGARDI